MRDDLFELYKSHKDELVLDLFDVVRLIGISEDDDDIYWIFHYRDGRDVHSSAVGMFLPLKDHLPEGIYSDLDELFRINDITEMAKGIKT